MDKKFLSLPILYFVMGSVVVIFCLGEMIRSEISGQPAFFGLFPYVKMAAVTLVTAVSLTGLSALLSYFVPATEEDITKFFKFVIGLFAILWIGEVIIYICFGGMWIVTALKIFLSLILNSVALIFSSLIFFVLSTIKEVREKNKKRLEN